MKKEVCFSISRLPPSLNTMIRWHWRFRNEMQHMYDSHVIQEWGNKFNKFIFTAPVKVTYVLSFPTKRTRDLDNYVGGTKMITDALKKTFLTRDDSEWITEISVKFIQGSEATVIFIEEVEGQDGK